MIVRIMGEGQWRADDALLARLDELDDRALAALEQGHEAELDRLLDEMAALVRAEGTALEASEIAVSDVVIPPSDLSLEETRRLVSEEHGLIPDLPGAA